MDFFGIGAAFQAMTAVYRQSATGTGRTTSLVESLKDGDRVCFAQEADAEHVRRLCAERGVSVDCVVIDYHNPHHAAVLTPPEGRFIFDHGWLEAFYQHQIKAAEGYIDGLEVSCSGEIVERSISLRAAAELGKWVSYRHEGEFESE